jgi:hypothetical protein
MDYLTYLGWITLLFMIYVEVSVGNVLFRRDSRNLYRMNVSSLLHFMSHPLTNRTMWSWSVLDLNYPFVLGVATLAYWLHTEM